MSPLALTLVGVVVFVVLGAIATLKLGDRLDRWSRRKARDTERRRDSEDESW